MKARCQKEKGRVAIKICIAEDKHSDAHRHEKTILEKLKVWHSQKPGPDNDGVQYVMKLLRTVDLKVMGSAFCMPLYCCDLQKMIDGGGFKSFKDRRSIYKGLLKGLAFLHARDFAHRDLKPLNILLDEEYKPCITDFGLCNMTNAMNGTPGYRAPETEAAPDRYLDLAQMK